MYKEQWLQVTGQVGKSTSCWCKILSVFDFRKITKIG